jgi:hypothetical protein
MGSTNPGYQVDLRLKDCTSELRLLVFFFVYLCVIIIYNLKMNFDFVHVCDDEFRLFFSCKIQMIEKYFSSSSQTLVGSFMLNSSNNVDRSSKIG